MVSLSPYLDAEWEPQPCEPSCPWPVDRVHLARFTLGDKALEREVLELFVGELPGRIQALRHAQTEKDWKMAAHTLKGSGRAVGAWRLASLAQSAERLTLSADESSRLEAVAQLESAAAEAAGYISRIYGAEPLKKSA